VKQRKLVVQWLHRAGSVDVSPHETAERPGNRRPTAVRQFPFGTRGFTPLYDWEQLDGNLSVDSIRKTILQSLEVTRGASLQMNVLFCINESYWQHLAVVAASLMANNPSSKFRFVVVSASKMKDTSIAKARSMVEAQGSTLETVVYDSPENYERLPVHSHLTHEMYLRLFMTQYLDSSMDRILYLDSDIVVCSDVTELWNTDLSDAYLGAAPEPYDHKQRAPLGFGPDDLYINSGVMIVNLAKWRSDDVVSKFLAFANTHREILASPDQDIINGVFRGHIRDVGYQWNWQALMPRFLPEELELSSEQFDQIRRSPRVVHFTSRYKPWFYRWQPHYKARYMHYLTKTPWSGTRPADHTAKNFPVRIAKSIQRWLEWHLPSTARKIRMFRRPAPEQ
jgi:lipopolysaccharide biosynthesis glycosyltransferase